MIFAIMWPIYDLLQTTGHMIAHVDLDIGLSYVFLSAFYGYFSLECSCRSQYLDMHIGAYDNTQYYISINIVFMLRRRYIW